MRYLPMEKLAKSIGKNFTDGIIDGQDPSVKTTLVIKKKMNITGGKVYPLIIYNYTDIKTRQYNKNSIGNNSVRNHH